MSEWELEKEDIWISVDYTNGHKTFFNVRYIDSETPYGIYKIHFDKINSIINAADPNDLFVLTVDYNLLLLLLL